jgi:hypothetical protein
MASILDLNPELRGQIAQATVGGGPKKRAKVFFTEKTAFVNEAKRMLPLLEKKYGKGNVDLIPVKYGDAKSISNAIAAEPSGDTFIFDHSGGKMLGIPMSKEDAIDQVRQYERYAEQFYNQGSYKKSENSAEQDGSKASGGQQNQQDLFYNYLANKYTPEQHRMLTYPQLEKEFVEMNEKGLGRPVGPFIPAEVYFKDPAFENADIDENNLLLESGMTLPEEQLVSNFQKYLQAKKEAEMAKTQFTSPDSPNWQKLFPKDYKGDCYYGACHFAERAKKFASETGIPTYSTFGNKWKGGNPRGGASTQEEFIKNLFYDADAAKYEKDKVNILQKGSNVLGDEYY